MRIDVITGYAHVSTEDKSRDAQTNSLKATDCERISADKIGRSACTGPELDELIEHLREDNVTVVVQYDRLACTLRDLLVIVETIQTLGPGFRSVAEDIDTTIAVRRLISHVLASIAQFERERISEPTREGLEAAKRRGRIGGRPPALTAAQKREARPMRDDEGRALHEIAGLFKVSTRTVRRALKPNGPCVDGSHGLPQ